MWVTIQTDDFGNGSGKSGNGFTTAQYGFGELGAGKFCWWGYIAYIA